MSAIFFFGELRRRHVYRVAVVYAGAAWLLLQLGSILVPAFGAPDWLIRTLFWLLLIGFPVALGLSWVFELTPEGVRRTEPSHADTAFAPEHGRRIGRYLNLAVIAVLALAAALLAGRQFLFQVAPGATAADTVTVVPTAIPDKSIAVLPLANENGDKRERYFSDGLSEDLITALSQFGELKVISRNSSFQFRDSHETSESIGRKLGVGRLLEGSVRRAGDTVRITVQMVDAADGSIVWSQHYDRPYNALFELQDDITTAVAKVLKARLVAIPRAAVQTDRPPSGDLQAYTAYLRGNFLALQPTGEADLRKANGFFKEAIRIDPHYALAYAALAENLAALAARYLGGADAEAANVEARVAVTAALALNPDLAAAHRARGWLLFISDFDWAGADAEYRRALQLAPHNGETQHLLGALRATLGHPEQAAALTWQALSSDPRHASWINWCSIYLSVMGRLDEAEQLARRAIALEPGSFSYQLQLETILILRGNAPAAAGLAQKLPPGAWRDVALALAYQIGADRDAADAALKILIDNDAATNAYQIAEVYALRNDAVRMFVWLNHAWAGHDPGIINLRYDAFLLRYRHDPRFAAFCRKVGLPAPKQA
ncbi:MAG TPA: hypothetical protein VFK24_03955 [Gammaproteobacteria bacterium]|nr:hypothetical protein [Gammaproteobacteria bacterium]